MLKELVLSQNHNSVILIFQINGGNFVIQYPKRIGNVRKQKPYSPYMPFPCANATDRGVGRSPYPPNSVHKLRPGDIDVIGAMGDSLIAGNGAMEEYALGTMIEYRGISWCAGEWIMF